MGLAASQARFLNLTARKTNIEYEGQQINQQRTQLANQSANYYNQMLTLSVPVPPSESNFSTVVYTFNAPLTTAGGNVTNGTYTINQVTGSDNDASILYTVNYTNPYSMSQTSPRSIYNDQGSYTYNGEALTCLADFNNSIFPTSAKESIATGLGYNANEYANVYVLNVGSSTAPSYEYYKKEDLPPYNGNSSNVNGYVAGSVTVYEQGAVSGAQVTRNNSTNRITAIRHNSFSTTGSISVTATTVKDSIAYDDAYAEYEYQTYLYQQRLEQINAQTSVIQAQDKKLELRLKQLDTEQNAISTEMDAINNVLDKSIEGGFKTFA